MFTLVYPRMLVPINENVNISHVHVCIRLNEQLISKDMEAKLFNQ